MLQHSFSDTLKGILTFSFTDYDKMYQNFYASSYTETLPIDPTNQEVTLDGYRDTTQRKNFVLSGNLVAEFESGDISHTLLYGAEFIDSSSENDRYNPGFDVTTDVDDEGVAVTDKQTMTLANLRTMSNGSVTGINGASTASFAGLANLNDNTSTDLSVLSLYVQDEIELSDDLTVVLGARYDNFDIDVTDHKKNKNGNQKDEEITPRAGIVYKVEDNISLYASYSETFVPQSGEQFSNLGDAGLDPDEYSNLEVGVKWNVADGFNVTAAVFESQQDALRENDDSDFTDIVDNEIEGFELQAVRRISDQWTVSIGYTNLSGENTTLDGKAGTLKSGDPAELPEDSFSIWNSFQLSEKLGFGLGAIHQGDSTPKGGSSKGIVPSFTRVDAAAYYKLNDNLRLQVNIENLLDEEYYPHAYSSHQFTVGAPLNATVSISGSF
jgi:catecholate siderophore receptor